MPRHAPYYYIYWNLNKKVWSVKYQGKVIEHLKQGYLPTAFTSVSDIGRERVRREGVKNVHAYVVGESMPTRYHTFNKEDCMQVYYNPYNVDQFMVINGEHFEYAGNLESVYFTPDRKVFCKINNVS